MIWSYGFVTIRIFARTELIFVIFNPLSSFVTIRIFARTEPEGTSPRILQSFVIIRIFAGTDLKNEKGSDTRRKGRGTFPPTFYCVNVN